MKIAENLKILFLLIKSRTNENNQAPLYCKLTLKKNQARFALGYFINPKIWSQQRQSVIGKSEITQTINSKILETKAKIRKAENYYLNAQQDYTLQDIINKLQNKDNAPFRTLLQAYNYRYNQMAELLGKNYSIGTLIKAKQLQNSVEQFLKNRLRVKDISINRVNIQFIQELEHYLIAEKQFSTASVNKTIQKLKSIMKMAYEFGVIEKPAFPNHHFKHEKPKIIFLNIDELEKLENYPFTQPRLNLIKDIFLFSVYTGLHYSDAMSLSNDNIVKGIDEKDWIVYTRQKTGVEIQIPILEKTKQLIAKFKKEYEVGNKILPKYSNQKINSYLKEIADIIGIDKPLSHKIARKTFGSVLLYYNVPMKVVSKLLGHSSVLITEKHYADVELKKLGEEMGRVSDIMK